MPIESLTRIDLRRLISGTVGDLVVAGTASSATSTTLVDTSNILFTVTDALKGAWGYIHTGTGAGQERNISASNTSSGLTVTPAWTTTPDSTSQYHIFRRFRAVDYNDAINAAIRKSRAKLMEAKRDVSLLTNGNLLNPLFTNWTTTTAVASWTASGASLTQDVVRIGNIMGQGSLNYYAMVRTLSATVRLQVTDGTTTTSDNHAGDGKWELLRVQFGSPVSTATAVAVRVNNSAGASLTQAQQTANRIRGPYSVRLTWNNGDVADIDWVFAPDTQVQWEYTLPSNFHSLHAAYVENGSPSDSDPAYLWGYSRLASWDWHAQAVGGVNPDAFFAFRRDSYVPASNLAITLEGMKTPDVLTADSDVLDCNSEPIRLYASSTLLAQTADPLASYYRQEYDEVMKGMRVAYPAGSRIVNPH